MITPILSDFDDANGCAIQVDGRIVAAGFTSGFSLGTDSDLAVVRYLGDGTVQVHAMDAAMGLAPFPNPAEDALALATAPAPGAVPVILDATGREVLRPTIIGHVIDISMVPAGVHHLQLIRDGHVVAHARFVKR